MNRSTATASVDRAFDRFLQAPVDEDRKERVLSVLSALARLDLDPWTEAAALADLPTDAAIQRLAALILTLPNASAVPRDASAIATRLVARLPSSRPMPGDSEEQAGHRDERRNSDMPEMTPPARGGSLTTIALIVAVILLLISMLTGRPPQALFGAASPTRSSAAASLKVTPRAGEPPAKPLPPTSK